MWLPRKREIAKIVTMKIWIDIKRPPCPDTGARRQDSEEPRKKGGSNVLWIYINP